MDRLLWAVMLALHGYGLTVGVAHGSLSASSVLGLGLANLLFLFKLLDVAWLRFRWTPRVALVWLVAIAIAHAELIPHVGGAGMSHWTPLVVATLGGLSVEPGRRAGTRSTERGLQRAMRRPQTWLAAWQFAFSRADAHAVILRRIRATTFGRLDPPPAPAV